MFCPEDGTKCRMLGSPSACGTAAHYRCPLCGTMWFYDGEHGSYEVVAKESAAYAEPPADDKEAMAQQEADSGD